MEPLLLFLGFCALVVAGIALTLYVERRDHPAPQRKPYGMP